MNAFRTAGDFLLSDIFDQAFITFVGAKRTNGRAIYEFTADPDHEKNPSRLSSLLVEFDMASLLPVKFDCAYQLPSKLDQSVRRNVTEFEWASFPGFGMHAPKTKAITSYTGRNILLNKDTMRIEAFPLDEFDQEKCYTSHYGIVEPFKRERYWTSWIVGFLAAGAALVVLSKIIMRKKG
jgi:hypothetical protein